MPAAAASLLRDLRGAPIALLCAAALPLLAWFAADDGGYPVAVWAPAGIAVAGLLTVALVSLPNRWRTVPSAVRIAVVALAAYAVWGFASMAWAPDPGAAWQGSLRTAVYVGVFCLFALWPQRERTAAALLGAWTLTIIVVAVVWAAKIGLVGDPRRLFAAGRLLGPAGYPNASAALVLMGFWPALTLAAAPRCPWPLRGVFAGGAVAILGVALASLSRGSLIAMPICAVIFFAVVRGRVRHALTLLPIAAAAGVAVRPILDLTDQLGQDRPPLSLHAADTAARAILVGAVVVGVLYALGGLIAGHRRLPAGAVQRAHRAAAAGLIAAAVAGVIVALALIGNPVTRVNHAWDSFKGGYTEYSGSGRLSQGLGSNRYDFYRVALNVFREHPLAGVGVDNYYQQYLRDGRSVETPRYPHSVELRALEQTGLVGAGLLALGLGAAFWGAARAVRGRSHDGLGPTIAAGAGMAALYWLVHGSADWFFEYGGMSTTAFALLGLACAGAPRRRSSRKTLADRAVLAPVLVVMGLGVVALGGLWLADRDRANAARIFASNPGRALGELDRARTLDPFSADADSLAGSIAGRLGDLSLADDYFAAALERVPDDEYATLERGVIASAQGRREDALAFLQRAVQLAPRDATARDALTVVRAGGRLDPAAVTRRILEDLQRITG